MAPLAEALDSLLGKRQIYNNCPSGYYYSYGSCYSGWSWYGRWVFAGVVIFVVLLIFLIFACVAARRRRSRGQAPMYGTAWMAPRPQYGNNPGAYNNNNAPPAYGAPPGQSYPMQNQYTGNTYTQNDGYYASGPQAPKNTYDGHNTGVYSAPDGPPPGHVVR